LLLPITHVFAGIPTADFESALPWYERFLGHPPDRFPRAGEAVWQLTETGLVYLVADPERAGHTLITLIVDDLDERLDELAGRGILQLQNPTESE
jgi:hypothetical protein